MKKNLRNTAIVTAMAALAFWAISGGNTGWTKSSIPVKTVDPVTGIEGISYEKKFVPGIDFLGVAGVVTGILAGVAFLLRNPTETK